MSRKSTAKHKVNCFMAEIEKDSCSSETNSAKISFSQLEMTELGKGLGKKITSNFILLFRKTIQTPGTGCVSSTSFTTIRAQLHLRQLDITLHVRHLYEVVTTSGLAHGSLVY